MSRVIDKIDRFFEQQYEEREREFNSKKLREAKMGMLIPTRRASTALREKLDSFPPLIQEVMKRQIRALRIIERMISPRALRESVEPSSAQARLIEAYTGIVLLDDRTIHKLKEMEVADEDLAELSKVITSLEGAVSKVKQNFMTKYSSKNSQQPQQKPAAEEQKPAANEEKPAEASSGEQKAEPAPKEESKQAPAEEKPAEQQQQPQQQPESQEAEQPAQAAEEAAPEQSAAPQEAAPAEQQAQPQKGQRATFGGALKQGWNALKNVGRSIVGGFRNFQADRANTKLVKAQTNAAKRTQQAQDASKRYNSQGVLESMRSNRRSIRESYDFERILRTSMKEGFTR